MSPPLSQIDLRMSHLYREETFTDRRVGSIRRLVPISSDGTDDKTRAVVFEGQTTILTQGGSLPLSFEIDARTLSEAFEKFAGTAQTALESMLKELDELRRERASSIIVPGQSGLDLGQLGGPRGGTLRKP